MTGIGNQSSGAVQGGKIPGHARRWMKYLLGFGVSVAVGLAPYLGKLEVPLFTPLLSLIPASAQDVLLPLSAALMGLVAVVVQWYGYERRGAGWWRKVFGRLILFAAVAFLALLVVHTFTVARVPFLGGEQTASFVVGFGRPDREPCPATLSDAECIKVLSFDPARIESFWGDRQVRLARLCLFLSYMSFTSAFGLLVGVLLLREEDVGKPAR